MSPERNTRSLPFRRYHRHLPYWLKRLLNWYFKRFGDPGDRRA
jgi:hypothetical protein